MAHLPEPSRSPGPAGLAALFGMEKSDRFLEENWPNAPRVFHHEERHAPEIWRLADLQSLEQVLSIAVPDTVFANLPDLHEEYSQIQLGSAADAKKVFACGMGISMEPELARLTELIFWLRAIRRDLGLAEDTYGRCNIYASPDGGRTGCHYDQNINFVCQITGEKTWDLAPNTHVMNPVARHTIGTPANPATSRYAKGPLPEKIPDEGRTRVVLKPGSVLFVPRGYWHQTSAKGDSISLNFTFDQRSWAEVTAKAICRRLLNDEAWRFAAFALRGEGPLRVRAEAEFEALLRKSAGMLGNIRFDDLE